jgi:drug/metabolite transporter (DMT)-like permease
LDHEKFAQRRNHALHITRNPLLACQNNRKSITLALTPNLRGAFYMAISMAGFTINDTFVKMISGEMNIGQIMFVRGLMASIMIFLLCWKTNALASPKLLLNRAVLGRSTGEALAAIAFLTGLAHMPIGNASAILQALPLAVTMGAALVLGEHVGWRRWLAISIGFTGVMIIVRPGTDGFNVWSLLILICVFFAAARDLFTRAARADIPTGFMSLATSLIITITGLVLIIPLGGWSPMTTKTFSLLVAASCFIVIAYQYIIQAMRTGEIGFIAPFRYTSLLWAIGLGYIIFNDVPDWPMIIGAGLVIVTGVYTFNREQMRSKAMAHN